MSRYNNNNIKVHLVLWFVPNCHKCKVCAWSLSPSDEINNQLDMNGKRVNYNHRLMMLRNECGGDATTTYGGTTKITTLSSTTSASMTQSSSSSTSAQHLQQWTGGVEAGGDMDKKTGAGNDVQRNHMLDAIAVGVVLFCFLTFVPQRQTFPLHIIIPVIWPH